MVDSDDEMDGGTALLGVWASRSMEWSDVAVATAETSYALVQKDSATERGKRLCVSGMIVEIHVDRVKNQPDQPATYNGNLMSDGNVVSFVAVGDTGTLVAQSFARLCGVVTGAHHYSNSAGGRTHAVWMVGMFDLPSNRAAKRRTTAPSATPSIISVTDRPKAK